MQFQTDDLLATDMDDNLDPDVQALKNWLRSAWRHLADSNLTRFEQRELRNYMKDAERALRSGLKQIATRELARRELWNDDATQKYPEFRLLSVDA
jgi:hypothetical protein